MKIKIKTFATKLGVSRQAIAKRVYRGDIPAIKLDGTWFLDDRHLKRYKIKVTGQTHRLERSHER